MYGYSEDEGTEWRMNNTWDRSRVYNKKLVASFSFRYEQKVPNFFRDRLYAKMLFIFWIYNFPLGICIVGSFALSERMWET